jgi:sugar transferase (PEP-CTERM system associated)
MKNPNQEMTLSPGSAKAERAMWKGGVAEMSLPAPVAHQGAEEKTNKAVGILFGAPQHRWLLFLGDIALLLAANLLSAWIRFGEPVNVFRDYGLAVVTSLIIYPAVLYVFDLYNLERTFRSWETEFRSLLTVVLGGAVSMVLFYLLPQGAYWRGVLAIQMVLVLLLLNGWRRAYGALFQAAAVGRTPVVILGAGHAGRAIHKLLDSPFSPYDVKGFLDDDLTKRGTAQSPSVLGGVNQLGSIAKRIGVGAAILAIPRNRSTALISNVLDAKLEGIKVLEMADIYEELTGTIPIRYIADQWLLSAEGFSLLHKEYIQRIKRLTDVAFSGLLLLLTAPLFAAAAIAIRLESPGPIFYKQKRVGKRKKIFTIYKFRSMRVDAEAGGARWAAEKDPRVTKVGKFLRQTHVDEIPQIWNLFRGDMSLVGPRPERPEFVEGFNKTVPYYAVRHTVKPGMTGWAQINYRYGASEVDTKKKLEFDLYYVKNMSLLLDFKILLRTIGVVILGDGAR